MTVKITLSCDGCHKETGPHLLPRREFRSFDGKGYGFGMWEHKGLDDVQFPDGWLYSDPLTGCTYCPECWAEITAAAEPEPPTYDEALGRRCDAEARYRRDMIDAGRGHLLGD